MIRGDAKTILSVIRTFDNGREIEGRCSGQMSADDLADFFRGVLVAWGYTPEFAATLRIGLDDDAADVKAAMSQIVSARSPVKTVSKPSNPQET